MADDDKFWTDNIWDWVAIKMADGPDPQEIIVANKKVIAGYNHKEIETKLNEGKKYVPTLKAVSLYNHYKRNIAFKKIDEEKADE